MYLVTPPKGHEYPSLVPDLSVWDLW